MSLPKWLKQFTKHDSLLELLDRVTARSQAAVWSRIYPTALAMAPCEARGYIRARAALVIHREIQIATSGVQLSTSHQRWLYRSSAEHLVSRALTEIARQRPQAATVSRAA